MCPVRSVGGATSRKRLQAAKVKTARERSFFNRIAIPDIYPLRLYIEKDQRTPAASRELEGERTHHENCRLVIPFEQSLEDGELLCHRACMSARKSNVVIMYVVPWRATHHAQR